MSAKTHWISIQFWFYLFIKPRDHKSHCLSVWHPLPLRPLIKVSKTLQKTLSAGWKMQKRGAAEKIPLPGWTDTRWMCKRNRQKNSQGVQIKVTKYRMQVFCFSNSGWIKKHYSYMESMYFSFYRWTVPLRLACFFLNYFHFLFIYFIYSLTEMTVIHSCWHTQQRVCCVCALTPGSVQIWAEGEGFLSWIGSQPVDHARSV